MSKPQEVLLRTFKYRLYPSKAQERNLLHVRECCRSLYNMALAERKYGYQLAGRRVTLADTEELAKRYRATFPKADQLFSQTAQSVVKRVDSAYQNFFRRRKAGKKGGYPRFKGRHAFNSFEFKQYGNGVKLDGKRLKLFGIGRVAVRWHRPLQGKIKLVRILYQAGHWYACLVCEVALTDPLPQTGSVVGIDVGISALITTSAGEKVANPNFYRTAQKELRRRQRKLARAQRGSHNRRKAVRRVQRQQQHVARQRADFLHKLSVNLIRRHDALALEDLSVGNMVKNHHLSKSILDSAWSLFRDILTYKAESAGRQVAFNTPAYTTQDCSTPQCVYRNTALTLADRTWTCPECHVTHDRDVNAAINILKQTGWVTPVNANAAPLASPRGGAKRKRGSEAARL